MPEPQAKAEAEALQEALASSDVATGRDIERLDARMENRFERLDGELRLVRWMLGIVLAGVLSLILEAFF